MVDYLTNTLGVSPSCITNLRNEQASRRGIKKSIAALTLDDRIQPGNPILIFFAGHGAQAKAPHWAAGSLAPDRARIEMILPVDFKPETNEVEDWQGISDITLAALLSDLAKTKGDNIVRMIVFFVRLAGINSSRRLSYTTVVILVLPHATATTLRQNQMCIRAASNLLKIIKSSRLLTVRPSTEGCAYATSLLDL